MATARDKASSSGSWCMQWSRLVGCRCDGEQLGTRWQVAGFAEIPGEACALQRAKHPPPRIPFAASQAQFRRAGKRMVVVVPRLAHRQQRGEAYVEALHAGAAH